MTTTLRDFENMIGSRFSDTLTGTRSDNELTGGEGFDRMSGAGGNDTFIFRTIAEMGLEAGARDVITDFALGDRLDFSDIGDALGLSLDFVGTP